MNPRFYIIAIVILLSFWHCEKNSDIPNKDYPYVITHTADNIDTTGVTFNGEIIFSNKQAIIEYGFVWSFDSIPTIYNYKYTFHDSEFTGKFHKQITFDLPKDHTINTRAYAKTKSYLIYGNVQSFASEGNSIHKIDSFSPQSGTDGEKILIKGTNFSLLKDRVSITIGDKTAVIDSINPQQLITRLPTELKEGSHKIAIKIDQKTVYAKNNFMVKGPEIASFSPTQGFDGSKVKIIGKNFSNQKDAITVSFGNTPTKIRTINHDTLIVIVPNSEYTGKINISVNVSGKKVVSSIPYDILGPTILKIDPPSPEQNTIVDIHGKHFSNIPGENIVHLGEFKLDIVSTSTQLLKVKIPEIYSDSFNLSIKAGRKKNTYPEKILIRNAWSRIANLPGTGRIDAVSFSIGNKGYIGTGRLSSLPSTSGHNWKVYDDFWEYNPQTNQWVRLQDFPGGIRCFATGFSIGNKGYLGTGYDGYLSKDNSYNDFWEFEPSNNNWTKKADFPGDKRWGAVGFSIGNKGYIGFGYRQNDLWEYNPQSDSWTKVLSIEEKLVNARVFVVDNKAFIFLGDKLWQFDPNDYSWTQKANFPGAVNEGVAFSIDNMGYIGTGYNQNDYYTHQLWKYNPNTNAWTRLPSHFRLYRIKASGFSIGKFGFIGTGLVNLEGTTSDYQGDFYKFDPYYE